MDPLTHALVGASAARVALARPLGRSAWLPGALGALLPDVDTLIRSSADPLLYAEYHRHFTHSLMMIPVGGALAALPWVIPRARRRQALPFFGAATLGYATHGPLDASTTYGTLLFWPFSHERVALSWISIIDPLFTLILLVGVLLAVWRRSAVPVGAALVLCGLYLGAGAVQRARALQGQHLVSEARGHSLARGDAFPTMGNQIVWRSLYQAGDSLYMDRVRVPWRGRATFREVAAVPLLTEARLPDEVRADPRRLRDFRRFSWFSRGWVAPAPSAPEVIGDARYSLRADAWEPVWGIRFRDDGERGPPTEWVDRSRGREPEVRTLVDEVRGREPGYREVPGR
jgi:inner membrane protein